MANINLISARRAERVRITKIARGLLVTLLTTGALGLGSAAYMTGRIYVTQQRVLAAEEDLEQLRPILQEIEAAEKERQALKPKLATLVDAQQATNHWYSMLDGLKRAVPGGTWLTSLAVEPGSGKTAPVIRLNGMTVNQTRVGETMYRLTQQPEHYSKVDLRYSETRRGGADEGVTFELAARLAERETETKSGEDDEAQTQ